MTFHTAHKFEDGDKCSDCRVSMIDVMDNRRSADCPGKACGWGGPCSICGGTSNLYEKADGSVACAECILSKAAPELTTIDDLTVKWDRNTKLLHIGLGKWGFAVTREFMNDSSNMKEFADKICELGGGKLGLGSAWDKCQRAIPEPNAPDPRLIERIARAMCKADGNDPDEGSCRFKMPVLSGLAGRATRAPSGAEIQPTWTLYYNAAEAAIIEMEVAAMEADDYPLSPEEDAHLSEMLTKSFQKTAGAFATQNIPSRIHDEDIAGELQAEEIRMLQDMVREDPEALWRNNNADQDATKRKEAWEKWVSESAKAVSDAIVRGASVEKAAADFFNAPENLPPQTASKDAPLIEAIRKQREKDGF